MLFSVTAIWILKYENFVFTLSFLLNGTLSLELSFLPLSILSILFTSVGFLFPQVVQLISFATMPMVTQFYQASPSLIKLTGIQRYHGQSLHTIYKKMTNSRIRFQEKTHNLFAVQEFSLEDHEQNLYHLKSLHIGLTFV